MNIRAVSTDLTWYFNHAAATFGYRSSYSGFVSAVLGLSAPQLRPDSHIDDKLMTQVRRYRRISSVMARLPLRTRRALEATYNQLYRYPVELVQFFESRTGSALFNSYCTELDPLIRLYRNRKLRSQSDAEKLLTFNIGVEAKQIYASIHQQYSAADHQYRSEERSASHSLSPNRCRSL